MTGTSGGTCRGAAWRSSFGAAVAGKIVLTYFVPFFVATWGALANSRAPHPGRRRA